MRTGKDQEVLTGYLFVLPDLIGLLVFIIVPMVLAVILSFYDWGGVSAGTYIGFANYKKILVDKKFFQSLLVTFKYVITYVPLTFGISLALALLVQAKSRGVTFFRAIYFIPSSISLVVIAFIWKYIFQDFGLANAILSSLGIARQPFLGSTSQAIWVIVSCSVYVVVGYYMIIFLAALNEVPEDYYNAARIDGASGWQIFRHITLPLIKPTSFFVIVMTLLQGLQAFDQIYVITRGGPFYGTTTTLFYAYQKAFVDYEFGYGSAVSVFLFLVQLVLSVMVFRMLKGGEVEE